jgi:hypothetical protein
MIVSIVMTGVMTDPVVALGFHVGGVGVSLTIVIVGLSGGWRGVLDGSGAVGRDMAASDFGSAAMLIAFFLSQNGNG